MHEKKIKIIQTQYTETRNQIFRNILRFKGDRERFFCLFFFFLKPYTLLYKP